MASYCPQTGSGRGQLSLLMRGAGPPLYCIYKEDLNLSEHLNKCDFCVPASYIEDCD